jgi:spore coat protein U-like protein
MIRTRRRHSIPCGIDRRRNWGQQLAASLPWIVALVLILVPQQSWAVSCSVSTQGVNFGAYDPFGVIPHDNTGSVTISCDGVISFQISLNTGMGSYAARQMTSGSSTLHYNLYTDATHTTVWGDGTGGTGTRGGQLLDGNFTVYGRIPTRQNVSVGTYSDAIMVTVDY